MLLIEGGDLGCGELLILVHQRVRDLPGGTLIGIATTDPAAVIDLPAWCYLTGHDYRGPATTDAGSPFVIQLAERPNPIDPDRPWHRLPVREAT
ncbi:MAG TPA: sulfurtransferase TusA family protein [Dermatophilaceae bacterium]|nr:sulfurtransferase TusA family protein [Dermatophilaceae bacterium]